jgi:hypothetical protein
VNPAQDPLFWLVMLLLVLAALAVLVRGRAS